MDLKKLEKDNANKSYYTIGWLIKHVIIASIGSSPIFVWAIANNIGFMTVFIMSSILFVAAFLGDLLRKATKPQVIISDGALDMLRRKIYWSIGPQFIAMLFTFVVIFLAFNIFSEKDNLDKLKNQQRINIERSIDSE